MTEEMHTGANAASVYEQQIGKVLEKDHRFEHVMALMLNPASGYNDGIIRCILSRAGSIHIKGYVDRSALHIVEKDAAGRLMIGDRLHINGEEAIVAQLTPPGWECIGLEDPDIWIDYATGLMHVYFTIPIIYKDKTDRSKKTKIHLGHAVGKDLRSLTMTEPTLMDSVQYSAKEVSIAPLTASGIRYNLIESRDRAQDMTYSTVNVAMAKDMGKPWAYGDVVFHPKHEKITWASGHASPGPLLPQSFVDVGAGKCVGFLNGREKNKQEGDIAYYLKFSVGLFIYDYEKGVIDWVSPERLIFDTEAESITFASQFIDHGNGIGTLYAHVDDSFVRAYTITAAGIKASLA